MNDKTIFSVQWFNSIIKKIDKLEQDWKNNIIQFNDSILMEEHQVTTLLQISKSTLRRYRLKKYFNVYQIGKRNLYLQHDIIRGILTHLVK
ncbi:DNA-binding protein [Empedobacter sp. UBA5637]|uniref:DNA-binding protein n=2 Tax=Empedobacter TaxID=59734 RepID=UPI000571A5CD|nr:DNA-binding protein [Empedobacter sp. UBA5637]